MYKPPYFKFNSNEHLIQFLKEHLFGLLIVNDKNDDKLLMSHLPFELFLSEQKLTYFGHVASKNPIAEKVKSAESAYIVFQSDAHHYVSSQWYTQPTAPTWNYQAVHLKGQLKPLKSDQLRAHLDRMIEQNEARYNHSKLKMGDIPEKMVNAMIQEIIGFSFEVLQLESVNKMSQNRDDESMQTIISQLKASGRSDALKMYGEGEG